jgi:hypothetical protein
MATRKQIWEAFTIAKRLTARNGEECQWGCQRYEFICHALDKLGHLPGAMGAKAVINDRFRIASDGRFSPTIYTWLSGQGIPVRLLTDDNVQAYKHRWLDSVIKEFSS